MVALAGRVMFTLIFFLSGITHFTDLASYVALMPEAIRISFRLTGLEARPTRGPITVCVRSQTIISLP